MSAYYCLHCQRPTTQVCSCCQAAHFCSGECQRQDWNETHRFEAIGAPLSEDEIRQSQQAQQTQQAPRRRRQSRFPELEKRTVHTLREYQRTLSTLQEKHSAMRYETQLTRKQRRAVREFLSERFPDHGQRRKRERVEYLQRLSELAALFGDLPTADGRKREVLLDEETRAQIALLFRMQDLLLAKKALALLVCTRESHDDWMDYAQQVTSQSNAIVHRALFAQERVTPEDVQRMRDEALLRGMTQECVRALWQQICEQTVALMRDVRDQRAQPSTTGFKPMGVKPGLGGQGDGQDDDERQRAYVTLLGRIFELIRTGQLAKIGPEFVKSTVDFLVNLSRQLIAAIYATDPVKQANTIALNEDVGDALTRALAAIEEGDTGKQATSPEDDETEGHRRILDQTMRDAGLSEDQWDRSTWMSILRLVAVLVFSFALLGLGAGVFDALGLGEMTHNATTMQRDLEAAAQQAAKDLNTTQTAEGHIKALIQNYQEGHANNRTFLTMRAGNMDFTSNSAIGLVNNTIEAIWNQTTVLVQNWSTTNVTVDPGVQPLINRIFQLCTGVREALDSADTALIVESVEKLQNLLKQTVSVVNAAAPEVFEAVQRLSEGATLLVTTIRATLGDVRTALPELLTASIARNVTGQAQVAELQTQLQAQAYDAPLFSALSYRLGAPHIVDTNATQPVVDFSTACYAALGLSTNMLVTFGTFASSIERRLQAFLRMFASCHEASSWSWLLSLAATALAAGVARGPTAGVAVGLGLGVGTGTPEVGEAAEMAFYALSCLIVTRNLLRLTLNGGVIGAVVRRVLYAALRWCAPQQNASAALVKRLMRKFYERFPDAKGAAIDDDDMLQELAWMSEDGGHSWQEFGAACDLLARGLGENDTRVVNRESAYLYSFRLPYEKWINRGLYKLTAITAAVTLYRHCSLIDVLYSTCGALWSFGVLVWENANFTNAVIGITGGGGALEAARRIRKNQWILDWIPFGPELQVHVRKAWLKHTIRVCTATPTIVKNNRERIALYTRRAFGLVAVVLGTAVRYQMTTFVAFNALHYAWTSKVPLTELGFHILTPLLQFGWAPDPGRNPLSNYSDTVVLFDSVRQNVSDALARATELTSGAVQYAAIDALQSSQQHFVSVRVMSPEAYKQLQVEFEQLCLNLAQWYKNYTTLYPT